MSTSMSVRRRRETEIRDQACSLTLYAVSFCKITDDKLEIQILEFGKQIRCHVE